MRVAFQCIIAFVHQLVLLGEEQLVLPSQPAGFAVFVNDDAEYHDDHPTQKDSSRDLPGDGRRPLHSHFDRAKVAASRKEGLCWNVLNPLDGWDVAAAEDGRSPRALTGCTPWHPTIEPDGL
jgi:hypothetical protein